MIEILGTTRYSRDTYNVVILSENNSNYKISTSPKLDFLRSKEKFYKYILTYAVLESGKKEKWRFCHRLFGLKSSD